jgi:hypothetical protein
MRKTKRSRFLYEKSHVNHSYFFFRDLGSKLDNLRKLSVPIFIWDPLGIEILKNNYKKKSEETRDKKQETRDNCNGMKK